MGREGNEGGKTRGPAFWDDESVTIFCDCCIKEVEAGRRPGTHFSKAGWSHLIANFNKAAGREYDKRQLKNKWDSLKVEWSLWKKLIGTEIGLKWSSSKKTIDASDEWWQGKLKVDKNLGKFRKRGIDPEMENKLDRMFTNIASAGTVEYGRSSRLLLSESVGASTNTNPVEGSDDSNESQGAKTSEGCGKKRTSEHLGLYSQQGKKSVVGKESVGGATKMSTEIDRLVVVVPGSNSSKLGLVKPMHGSSVPEAMELLEALPGGEEGSELWFFASDLFMSLEKRQLFCNIKNPEVKLQWLNRQRLKTSQ